MDKQTRHMGFNGEHPPREQFVMFLDGELSLKENQKWQEHLAACWECRTQISKTEEAISDIMEFENSVMKEIASRSLSNTDGFYPRLRTLDRKSDTSRINTGAVSRWLGSLGSWLSLLLFPNRTRRLVFVSLVCVVGVAIVFNLLPDRVSAGELYERSREAYRARVLRVTQPVVYRKVTVSIDGESAVFEVWNDVDRKRTKSKVGDDAGLRKITDELVRTYDENGMDIFSLLSSEDFQAWSEKLSDKSEVLTKTTLPGGEAAFRIDVENHGKAESGRLLKASLVIRESDWHPVGASFTVNRDGIERVINISEVRFVIVRGVSIGEGFF